MPHPAPLARPAPASAVPGARRSGIADSPLHGGRAPRWLFQRMTLLAREMTCCIVEEFSPDEVLSRLSDPYWFQAFGCVLGFDWHSSGLTTTVCGALKEGLKGLERELGLYVCGGKGQDLSTDAGRDRCLQRSERPGPRAPGVRQPHRGQGGLRRGPGRLSDLPP